MQSSRESCEMFLKALLARDHGLTEEDAQKKYSHNLAKLVDRALQRTSNAILSEARKTGLAVSLKSVIDTLERPTILLGLWSSYKVGANRGR